MKKAGQIDYQNCCGVLIDVQEFFLSRVGKRRQQTELKVNTANFVRLLNYFKIPVIVTIEKPVARKGLVPEEISKNLDDTTARFEKEFFDLTKENEIRDHLGRLDRKQMLLAGCETDVCVLQSCLGLLRLGFEVFVVEELLFSSSAKVESAIARMQCEGAISLSYKSLYYELLQAVAGGRHRNQLVKQFGPLPITCPILPLNDFVGINANYHLSLNVTHAGELYRQTVIASAAKQSRPAPQILDCFAALATTLSGNA